VIDLTVNLNNVLYHGVTLRSGKLVLATVDRRLTLKEFRFDGDSLHISGAGDYAIDSLSGNLHLEVSESAPDSVHHASIPGSVDADYVNPQRHSAFQRRWKGNSSRIVVQIAGRKDISGNFDLLLSGQLGKATLIDKLN